MTGAPDPRRPAISERLPWPLLLVAASALPVVFILFQIVRASRNIPFWDEFDSVLAPLLQLDAGMDWRAFVGWLFRLENEHRTVTSRLIFAALFGASGGVNFNVLCLIGNAALLGLCAVLIAAVRPWERRVRLGVMLAFGLFHLEHYEAFLWSGASIDHFLVLAFAGSAVAALANTGGRSWALGMICAVLATFTLAHGCVVWFIGAAMLIRRPRWLLAWSAIGAVTLAVFFHGYQIHSAHRLHDLSLGGLIRLGQFWLALLGGPLTFGVRSHAAPLGLGLVLLLGWLVAGGAWRREPVVLPLALFAVASLALVAFGRLEVAGPQIESRYLVLGSLAWTLAIFMALERWLEPTRPFRLLAWCLPALALFNVAANLASARNAETFVFSRDYPAIRFLQYGEEGHAGGFRLHPGTGTARHLLAEAAAHGIYRLPRFCEAATVPRPQPAPDMVTYVTDLTATERAVGFEGWAMFPHKPTKRGQIHVVLRSEKSFLVFRAFSVARPDVAKAFNEPLWRYCGYNFVAARSRLPAENFQVGLLITDGDLSELKMTENWLNLGPRPAKSPPVVALR